MNDGREDRKSAPLPEPARHPTLIAEKEPRRGRGFWAGVVILGMAIGALGWLGYPLLVEHWAVVNQRLPALGESLTALRVRLENSEADLRLWYDQQQRFRAKLDKLESEVNIDLTAARTLARELSQRAYLRAKAELDEGNARMDTRLASLESFREQEQTRIARLEQLLSETRGNLSSETTRMASQREALESRLAGLDTEVRGTRKDLDTVSMNLETRRVDFELTKDRSRQLSPGVSLCVTDIDKGRRQINGWMWIMPDRKTIWLRDQGVLEPLAFYSSADGKKREIVFTSVGNRSVAGYLVLPGERDMTRSALDRGDLSPKSGE